MNTAELKEELQASRQFMIDSWQKHLRAEPLAGVEQQIVDIIGYHPEFHSFIASPDALQYEGEDNPFLHLGLHLAILEQISINQPHGIREAYQTVYQKWGDAHRAAHHVMDCLNATLQEAFQQGKEPNPQDFLQRINAVL